jgi:hypothetical protein
MSEIRDPISQAELLRAVGRFLDERGWRDVRVIQEAGGVVVQGWPAPAGRAGAGRETARLSDGQVRAWLAEARAARRAG